jgi:flagellar protein FlaG
MQLPSIGNLAHPSARATDQQAPVTQQAATVASSAAQVMTPQAVEQNAAIPALPPLSEALQNINKTMQALGQDLEFSVDADSNRTIVKVIDQRTQEVIRQMPSAEALEIAKALDRVQGLLIRQKA